MAPSTRLSKMQEPQSSTRWLLEWFSSLDWKSAWTAFFGFSLSVYFVVKGVIKVLKKWEEWKGLRLTNKRLGLELDALTANLSKPQMKRIALEITGVPLDRPDFLSFRSHIEQWAKGKALEVLEDDIETLKARLEESEEELAEYRCPLCGAKQNFHGAGEGHNGYEVEYESFECGYAVRNDYVCHYCERDPDPPKIGDYILKVRKIQEDGHWKGYWLCTAEPKNQRGRKLSLEREFSKTADMARGDLIEKFNEITKRYSHIRAKA